jgi:hypothetical protein
MAAFQKLFSPFGHLNLTVRVPYRSHVGYMPFEGPVVPKNSPLAILYDDLRKVNLKPVSR